ncbi:MAG TPA: immunoglobulin domain-containing protein [Candidatus Hydrogenedens sp.]|nr:immunoglobulin domain-containing protein [Candidatus Hydrogenedens sp.]
MLKRKSLFVMLLFVGLVVGLSSASYAVQPPPDPAELDFCALLDEAYTIVHTDFAFLLALLGDDAALLDIIQCSVCDINGGIDPETDMPIPNGMLDGNYELRVIKELIQNPSKYANLASGRLPGQVKAGVNPADVVAAYNANYQMLYTDGMNNLLTVMLPGLWGLLQGLAAGEEITLGPLCTGGPGVPAGCVELQKLIDLFRNLLMVLAGYATVGDDASAESVATVADLLALCDLISEGSCLVSDMTSDPNAYQRLPLFLSKDGDADGDGYTNFAEYEAFADKGPGDAFIAAVLNPSVYPGYVPPAEDKIKIYPSGNIQVEEGGTIDLRVELGSSIVEPYSLTWTHNGTEISGEVQTRLTIRDVTNADAGIYQCVATDSSKGMFASDTVTVMILPEGSIPVATGIGLGIVTALCSVGGVMVLRRRK